MSIGKEEKRDESFESFVGGRKMKVKVGSSIFRGYGVG